MPAMISPSLSTPVRIVRGCDPTPAGSKLARAARSPRTRARRPTPTIEIASATAAKPPNTIVFNPIRRRSTPRGHRPAVAARSTGWSTAMSRTVRVYRRHEGVRIGGSGRVCRAGRRRHLLLEPIRTPSWPGRSRGPFATLAVDPAGRARRDAGRCPRESARAGSVEHDCVRRLRRGGRWRSRSSAWPAVLAFSVSGRTPRVWHPAGGRVRQPAGRF